MQIQTTRGPIAPEELGATLMHEHLLMAFTGWETDTGAPPLDREEQIRRCVDRVAEIKAGGFSSLLDPCPIDLGRDPEFYAEVADRADFNILFATGIYNEQYGAPYWRFKLAYDPAGEEHLAEIYIRELTEGVGPSRLKPAVIKLAVGADPASEYENKVIRAAARASLETGAPILTHTEGVGGDVLLGKLTGLGVAAHRVIIGHSDDSSDQAYHRRIVDGGAYIGFDRFGLEWVQTDAARVVALHSLLEDGYARHLIVSHDCAFCQRGRVLPDEALLTDGMHFTRDIAPKLRELGIGQATIDSLFRDNPRRYFCAEAPAQTRDMTAAPELAQS
jgi:phosphotriesterase-related protein